jgi:putative oxidoreductase
MKHNLFVSGRILFAITLAFFGVGQLMNAGAMSSLVPSFLSSLSTAVVYITGVCLLLAATSFIINRFTLIAGILVAIFLLLVIVTVHIPNLADPQMQQIAQTMIVKDSAMAAAALMAAGHSKS